MGRYLDLARRALGGSSEALPYEINEKTKKGVDADPYQCLARSALAKICRPDYPAGMIPWLGENHPSLYAELTTNLPDEIHRLWAARAPLDEFERTLGLWLEAHRTSCELYRIAHASPRMGDK
jgi:hypothetical protein